MPLESRAGHDLEAIEHHPIDYVAVILQEIRRREHVLRLLAGIADDHRSAHADAGVGCVAEEPAGDIEIRAFAHAVEDSLAAGFQASGETRHSGAARLLQLIGTQSVWLARANM